jgi:SAM-dependent methyltransferase
VQLKTLKHHVNGYAAMVPDDQVPQVRHDATTEEYAEDQREQNTAKVHSYLIPILKRTGVKQVLDVGCGVGTMVNDLVAAGYDAYGIDLMGLERHWSRMGNDKNRFFIVDPYEFELPFCDKSLDLAFSFGVIEHVGTSNGHSDRLPNFHEMRKAWLREIYRTIKVGGYLLMGGPNRNFPIDVAHGLDSRSSALEIKLSQWMKASVHKTWGDYFLWSYKDIPRYLEGLPYEMEALSIRGLVAFGRVPKIVRPLVRAYTDHLPKPLLGTAFNPWMMALIKRTG